MVGGETRRVAARAITAEAFGPFGHVLATAPSAVAPEGRSPTAGAVFEVVTAPGPTAAETHTVGLMERHPLSTQAFVPLDRAPYLVMVAPDAADGGPDLDRLAAFVVPGDVGVQYRVGLWHTPMTSLVAGARLVLHVHKDGSAMDCEVVDVAPVTVAFAVPPDRRPS